MDLGATEKVTATDRGLCLQHEGRQARPFPGGPTALVQDTSASFTSFPMLLRFLSCLPPALCSL